MIFDITRRRLSKIQSMNCNIFSSGKIKNTETSIKKNFAVSKTRDICLIFLLKMNKGNMKLYCDIVLLVGYTPQYKTVRRRLI